LTTFTSDVSHFDGVVDWAQARRAGIAAAAIKAAEGGGPSYRFTDPLFADQVAGAASAGMDLVGAYHCLSGDTVFSQIRYLQQVLGRQSNAVRHPWAMLDVEPFDELRRAGALPDFVHVEAFADAWWSQYSYPLALYLPRWVWDQWRRPSLTGLAGQIALVSSVYPDKTPRPFRDAYVHAGGDHGPGWAPYGGLTPSLWQFTEAALIPGVRGGRAGADCNAFRGVQGDLVHLLTGQPAGTPTTQGDDDMPTITGDVPFDPAFNNLDDTWLDVSAAVPVPLPAVGSGPGEWGPAWLYLAAAGKATIRYGVHVKGLWTFTTAPNLDLSTVAGPLALPEGTDQLLIGRVAVPDDGMARVRWHVQYGARA
jgi:glycosyl hydrolase family 25